jgi:hypothetical protein
MLAELLYYTITTGSSLQTLGEEYCDILQSTGGMGLPPSTLRRGVLVLLQSLGPYALEKLDPTTGNHSGAVGAWTPQPRSSSSSSRMAASFQPESQHTQQEQFAWLQHALRQMHLAATQLQAWTERLKALARERCPLAVQFFSENGPALVRLHLALFYVFGMYYQLPKRLTGESLLSCIIAGMHCWKDCLLLEGLFDVPAFPSLPTHSIPATTIPCRRAVPLCRSALRQQTQVSLAGAGTLCPAGNLCHAMGASQPWPRLTLAP